MSLPPRLSSGVFLTVLRVPREASFNGFNSSEGPSGSLFLTVLTVLRVPGEAVLTVFYSSEGPGRDSFNSF